MQVTLNADYAREGDTGASSRITQSGAYVGKFTMAKLTKANSGAQGIEFDFEDNNGRSAKYMTIYTHNKDGAEIWGFKQLHAIMTCMSLRQINGTQMQASVYDLQQRKEIQQTVTGYAELINVPVGLVLQKETYSNGNGDDRTRMNMLCAFDANTRCTATEKLDKAEAVAVDNILKTLTDKDTRKQQQQSAPPQSDFRSFAGNTAAASGGATASGAADINFDDDIPF